MTGWRPVQWAVFVAGALLTGGVAIYELSFPATAFGFMWTLRRVDWTTVALVAPNLAASGASLGGIAIAYILLRGRRPVAMAFVLMAALVVPPVLAVVGHSLVTRSLGW